MLSPITTRRPGKAGDEKQFLHEKQKKDTSRIARIVAAIPDKAVVNSDARAVDDLMCRTMTLSADWKIATPVSFNAQANKRRASVLKPRPAKRKEIK